MKAVKDPAVPRDDLYKSGSIHTGPGEPPSSVSRPTPRPKQVAARPVTKGKLLRPGGPNGGPSKLNGNRPNGTTPRAVPRPVPRPVPTPQALPAATPAAPQPAVVQPRIVPQPIAAAASAHRQTPSQASVRAPPPPPPAPPAAVPAAPKKPTAKVLYDFSSGQANELTIHAGEVVQIVSKEGNGMSTSFSFFLFLTQNTDDKLGWWLCMNTTTSAQGWTPEAYLEEIVVATPKPAPPPPPPAPKAAPNGNSIAAAKAKPAPPAPPAKRPTAAGRKPLAPPTRDSTVSINSQDSSGASGRATPNSSSNASLAGGLAEILRQRQSVMRPSHEEEDDW